MQLLYFRICFFWICSISGGHLVIASNPFGPAKPDGCYAQPPILSNPSGCNIGVPINDFSCDNSHRFQINVASAPGFSMGTDVYLREVRVIVQHEWDADLDMHLISPSGITVELSTDNGSGNDNYGNPFNNLCNQYTAFISHASASACNAVSITQGQAPFIGNFLPEGNLNDFNNGNSPVGLWTLQICDDGKEHYGTLEFVELVFEATACLPPSSVAVTVTDSTFATLNWAPGSHCSGTVIEYGPAGFTPGANFSGNGFIILAGCPPYTLTGLTPAFNYDLYIRESCGSNFSFNSCKISFATKCSPPPPTLVENFDAQDACDPVCGASCPITGFWKNALNDDFDWIVNAGPTSTSLTGPDDDVPGGGKYMYVETSGSACRSGRKGALISNCLEVHANPDTCDLSFNYMLYGVHVNSLTLEVTTNGGMNWQQIWQVSGNLGPQWRKKFINLDAYDGQIVQLRFTGNGGTGIRGDIAIDNIVFYGSLDAGNPSKLYYRDQDGDGYGRSDIFIASCQNAIFPGYVEIGGDCDDLDPAFNPGAAESPCDGIDLNCNGLTDDFFLPPPAATGDSVCSGTPGFVSAFPGYDGTIRWYDAPTGGNLLHEGSIFIPFTMPLNVSPNPVVHTFYAEEAAPNGCVSTGRSAVPFAVFPQPDISTADNQEDCAGITYDLNAIDVIDLNSTNGGFTFYKAEPFIPANEISAIVMPEVTSTYFIVSTAAGGCYDHTSVTIAVKPSPKAVITGDTTICRGGTKMLLATDNGNGISPLAYSWNIGGANAAHQISSNVNAGATDLYSVTVTGANGCSGVDSIFVKTVTGVSSVQSVVQSVTACNGNDGAITLQPLNGVSPFTYKWTGGNTSTLPGAITINNLTQGTYSFTITDSSPEACPFFLPVVIVNGPSAMVSLQNVTKVSCSGGSDGCIQISVSGNNPSILWSNGATGTSVCGLAAGTYAVTVTDGPCVNVLTVAVPQPEPVTASAAIKDVSCAGGNNGAISMTVFGGTTPYQYSWNTGQSVKNINNLNAGAYTLTITDSKACQLVIQNIFVKQPLALSLNVTDWKQVSCSGGSDGRISVGVQGGSPPFVLAWSNGATGSTVTNLVAGSYQVTVTDANGCSFTQNFNMQQPSPVSVQLGSFQNPVCDGIDDGFVNITASGGNGGYTYLWNNGSVNEDLSGLPPGNYMVTVTDQSGCTAISANANLIGPSNMQVAVTKSNPACEGIDNGSVAVSVISGGDAPYQFFWSTDDSDPSLQDLPAGSYTVTIIDNNGCKIDTTIELTAGQPISATVNVLQAACAGSASGQLSLNVMGGLQPYQIIWSTGQQGLSIAGLLAANYTATITDASGCKNYLGLIPLSEPPPINIVVENIEGIACHGGSEGSINVSVTGGVMPYQFHWTNDETTEDLQHLVAGVYRLTVTDANNCVKISDPLTVNSPAPIVPVADLAATSGCQGVLFDSVCVQVAGGLPPYSYLWNSGQTAPCLSGVPTGDYTVTITDAAGCTEELMSVKVPDFTLPLSATQISAGIQEICSGASNGSLMVAISGGTKPYQYIWSNGSIGMTSGDTIHIAGLNGNQYNVTITDNAGCTAVSPWMPVISYNPVQATIPGSQIQHLKCKFDQTGSINLNVTGGTLPYQFIWLNSNGQAVSSQEDLVNVAAGHYTVQVTDNLGCLKVVAAQINEPDQLLTISTQPPIVSHVSCFGFSDGAIDITASGGVPPYSYQWGIGASTADLQNLAAGNYSLTITDANQCQIMPPPVMVLQPEIPLSIPAANLQNVSCFELADGSIDVTVTGGTPPYFYSWNYPSTDEDLFNLPAGVYELTVMDTNICKFDTVFTITEPQLLEVTASATPATGSQADGTATAQASGGVAPFTFMWDNGQPGNLIQGLAAGEYTVTVFDANGCSATASVEVTAFTAIREGALVSSIGLFPNPTSGEATLAFEAMETVDLEVKIFNRIGQPVFYKKEEKVNEGTWRMDLTDNPSGVLLVLVFANGEMVYSGRLVVHR